MEEKRKDFTKQQTIAFVVIGAVVTLSILFGLVYSGYKKDLNYNSNIITMNTNVKNYSIVISQCRDKNNNLYICYIGNIITNNSCIFERITDSIYENVKIWLNTYYPIGKQVSVEYNIKTNQCDSYINTSVESGWLWFCGISLIVISPLFLYSVYIYIKFMRSLDNRIEVNQV
jgi:hypothetical protein